VDREELHSRFATPTPFHIPQPSSCFTKLTPTVCTIYPSACTYNFTILPGGYTPDVTCSIVDTSADPIHNSLVSLPCNNDHGNPWDISWGYNSKYDSAVMTVVNEAEQEDAWFGWNSISSTTDFEDVGPNSVYAVGTFTKL
jgi:hypothetical protein